MRRMNVNADNLGISSYGFAAFHSSSKLRADFCGFTFTSVAKLLHCEINANDLCTFENLAIFIFYRKQTKRQFLAEFKFILKRNKNMRSAKCVAYFQSCVKNMKKTENEDNFSVNIRELRCLGATCDLEAIS